MCGRGVEVGREGECCGVCGEIWRVDRLGKFWLWEFIRGGIWRVDRLGKFWLRGFIWSYCASDDGPGRVLRQHPTQLC